MSDQPVLTKAQLRAQPLPLNEIQRELALEVIERLNETTEPARQQIEALVYHCGSELVTQTLQDALQIEAEGGMMTENGRRRRTPGGVFFHLIAQRITREQLKLTIRLYQKHAPDKYEKGSYPKPKVSVSPSGERLPPPMWDSYREFFQELVSQAGAASTVKITLIGRPGAVKIQQDTVITTFEHTVKPSGMPKGVPLPPTTPTLYTVYIGLKQWRKVESAASNPEDSLIIEGVCAYDPQVAGMVVFASNITSKGLETAKRQAKQPPAEAKPAATPAPPAVPPVPLTDRYPLPPGLPGEVAQKLVDLYSAADQFRSKLKALDALPPDQRLGYGMTERLLKNTEDQIAALEKRYSK